MEQFLCLHEAVFSVTKKRDNLRARNRTSSRSTTSARALTIPSQSNNLFRASALLRKQKPFVFFVSFSVFRCICLSCLFPAPMWGSKTRARSVTKCQITPSRMEDKQSHSREDTTTRCELGCSPKQHVASHRNRKSSLTLLIRALESHRKNSLKCERRSGTSEQ